VLLNKVQGLGKSGDMMYSLKNSFVLNVHRTMKYNVFAKDQFVIYLPIPWRYNNTVDSVPWASEGFFTGEALGYFSKFFSRGYKSGEICFFPLKTKKTTFFC